MTAKNLVNKKNFTIGLSAFFILQISLLSLLSLGLFNPHSSVTGSAAGGDLFACSTVFGAIEDASVSFDDLDYNQNTDRLTVSGGASAYEPNHVSTYLKFDLGELAMDYDTIDRSYLALTVLNDSGLSMSEIFIGSSASDWNENSITAGTQPVAGVPIGTGDLTGLGNTVYFELYPFQIDINGRNTFTLSLGEDSSNFVDFASIVYGSGYEPQLVIPQECPSSETSSQMSSENSQSSLSMESSQSSVSSESSDTLPLHTENGEQKRLQAVLSVQNSIIDLGSPNSLNLGQILLANGQVLSNQSLLLNITNPNGRLITIRLATDSQGRISYTIPGATNVSLVDLFQPLKAFAQSFTSGSESDLQMAGNYSAFATMNYQGVDYTTNTTSWTVRPRTTVRSGGISNHLVVSVLVGTIFTALGIFAVRLHPAREQK